ncbi:hypothetical protein Tco_1512691, partial [Tanacetum coccineum]
MIITESSIRSDLYLEDAEGTDCLPTTTIFEELAKMGYEKPSQKLTFFKAFFSPQWKFFIHTITQCLSAKSTAWNEFSSTMASLIICLATNQKFNLSKRITPLFDIMMVQASEEVGEDSDHPTDSNQTPIIDQISTSSPPKKKQKSKRKQRKEAEVAHDETEHEESVPTPSNDPLPSGEDSMQLNDLMVLCTAGEAVTTAGVGDSVVPTIPTTIEETLAQTLMEIKAAKPKAKGIFFMIWKSRPLTKNDQVALDEDLVRNIQAQLDAKIIEEERLERQNQEEANIVLIESWENTQAMMEANTLLANNPHPNTPSKRSRDKE